MKYHQHIGNVYKKTFKMRGRSSLSEGMSFYSLWFGIMVFAIIFSTYEFNKLAEFMVTVCVIFLLLSLIPMLSLNIRRLHDHNFSGWMLLLLLFPLINFLVIYLLMSPGDEWDNKYGNYNSKIKSEENINKAID